MRSARAAGMLSAGGAGMRSAGGFSPGGACGLGWGGEARPFGYLVPVAVDLGEVLAAVMGTAGGIDGDVQVRAAGSVPAQVAPAAVGFLPRQADRPGVLGGQPGR